MVELRTISNSQMHVWENCPQEWYYGYEEELRRDRVSTKFFDFGNYAHELSHVYYQTMKAGSYKPGSDFLVKMMEARVRQDLTGENVSNVSKVWPRLLQFITQHSPLIDSGIKVLGVELEFHITVITPKGREIQLHGFIDLMYQDSTGRIRIRDTKTGGKKGTHSANSVKLDDQLLFYAVAMTEMYGQDILDVEINWISSTFTKEQKPLSELFALYRYQHTPVGLSIAKANILQKIDRMLDMDTYKNYSPRCPNCQFFDICHLESRGQNVNNLIANTYKKGRSNEHRDRSNKTSTGEEHSFGNKEIEIRIINI